MPLSPRRVTRNARLLPALALVLATTALTGCSALSRDDTNQGGSTDGTSAVDAYGGNPFAARGQTLVGSPRLPAAARQATADGRDDDAARLERLAEVPTGIWLTPEKYPAGEVGPYVSAVVAGTEGRTVPVFVVYGFPDRDCTGGFSAGGLDADSYLPWVDEIAAAAGSGSATVLEPDALASTDSCGGEDRLDLLASAVDSLDAAGVTTYVDAGHSHWVDAQRTAELLERVGVEDVRGFSTNVANYQPLDAEQQWAARVSDLVGGAHYVIDTSRDGDPVDGTVGQPVDDWCNPPDRSLGETPGFVDDGTALDALLWVKPPAESDGTCHGGPPAGDVWIDRALALATAAGW